MGFVVASAAVQDVVRGPVRPARVVAVVPSAVYLSVEGAADPGGALLALLARDAVRVPIGLVTAPSRTGASRTGASRTVGGLIAPRVGDPATVGDGVLALGHEEFRPTRYWDPRVPRLCGALATEPARRRADALGVLAAGLPPDVGTQWLEAVAPLGAVLAEAAPNPSALGHAVRGLVGLGPGLTPAGDDVLAGALVALAAVGNPRRRALGAAVTTAVDATTPVSAALLRQACAGRAVPELIGLLRALAGSGDLDAALGRLSRVGHTSGAALALGVRLALRAVDRPDVGRAA